MRCWDPAVETMPEEALEKLQYKLLKTLVTRLYARSPFYHERMRQADIHPDDIRSRADIRLLPFMYKTDLRDNYPDRIFSSSQDDLVRYHVSSGTTGKPTVVGYTKNDIEIWTTSLARALTSCGLGRGDVIQVSYGYGLFTGGLGLHYGAERIGATVLPTSVGNTERQIELMQDLRATAIACTPSYLIHLGEAAERLGISIKNDTHLKSAIIGAEPWSETMKQRIFETMGVRAYDIYGTSEISGPMFSECSEQKGIHIWGDIALTEIIDPETGEPLPPGEPGELVMTILGKEALPMIRYRIGDLTKIIEEPCPCGRTHPRIQRISGRVDDMLIIRGINVFPSAIEHTILGIPELSGHFMIEVDRIGPLDEMLVRVEVAPEAFSDKINDLINIKRKVEHILKNALNIAVTIELSEPGSLPRFEGKAKRVIDRRVY
ncbi:MAG: phenylacetate--CoA ligase family protein [Methanocalculus sp. MSAO_Arc1]|uniref:phenylacetate--CoA ligase family protein n=1 Tax=Methanocalculus sp. MSAO_Arc1 TaxID=2293854 RepID=UPI000FECE4C0|nr:phenylacetate--CoA ligase [Methanocalculus sp. MSAO_Arc1]RQD79210.1 MAG: phenylacetate--CoA ligase family protein [Methanocalculus sp. MSAO_Arc1]